MCLASPPLMCTALGLSSGNWVADTFPLVSRLVFVKFETIHVLDVSATHGVDARP